MTKLSESDSAHGLAYIGLSNTILFALTAQILVTSRDGISTQEYTVTRMDVSAIQNHITKCHTCFFVKSIQFCSSFFFFLR